MKGAVNPMISIDTRSREPIYLQLEAQIIRLINLGVYEANCPLPSIRTMAFDLGINPNTVARAYKELEQQNIIYTIIGKGVFVSKDTDSQIKAVKLDDLEKTLKSIKRSGIEKQDVMNIINSVWREQNND